MNNTIWEQIKEIRDNPQHKDSSDIHFLLGCIEQQERYINGLKHMIDGYEHLREAEKR